MKRGAFRLRWSWLVPGLLFCIAVAAWGQVVENGNGIRWTSSSAETWSGDTRSNARGETGVTAGAFDASLDAVNGNAVTGRLGLLDPVQVLESTPTFTPTPTPTFTSTFTPTFTPTLMSTPTATETNTPAETASPTPTATDTPTSTPSPAPSGTPTRTPTSTSTVAPTVSHTPTPSQTPTATPTATPTPLPRHWRLFEFSLLWHADTGGEYDLVPDGQIDDKDLLQLIENW